jgi:hypothetical protein
LRPGQTRTILEAAEQRENAMSVIAQKTQQSFAEFYAAYLTRHTGRTSRELHFAGATLAALCLVLMILTANVWWLLAALAAFYGLAWLGHRFEKNQPPFAFPKQPLYSFLSAWLMYWQMLTGQISF